MYSLARSVNHRSVQIMKPMVTPFIRAAVVQYLRPEIIGFVLGALAAALAFRDFRPRTGSAPFVRFVLGVFAMIGALVFLGCPWRALLRLAGEGDGDAAVFVFGMIVGAGFAHNFGLASSPAGVGPHGIAALVVGFAVCLAIGFSIRKQN